MFDFFFFIFLNDWTMYNNSFLTWHKTHKFWAILSNFLEHVCPDWWQALDIHGHFHVILLQR